MYFVQLGVHLAAGSGCPVGRAPRKHPRTLAPTPSAVRAGAAVIHPPRHCRHPVPLVTPPSVSRPSISFPPPARSPLHSHTILPYPFLVSLALPTSLTLTSVPSPHSPPTMAAFIPGGVTAAAVGGRRRPALCTSRGATAGRTQVETRCLVVDVGSVDQLKVVLDSAKEAEALVVIDYSTTWCGPCKVRCAAWRAPPPLPAPAVGGFFGACPSLLQCGPHGEGVCPFHVRTLTGRGRLFGCILLTTRLYGSWLFSSAFRVFPHLCVLALTRLAHLARTGCVAQV